MHGPYKIQIREGRYDGALVVQLSEDEARAETFAIRQAERFYQDATPALVDGALRVGVFSAAALLGPGEEATIVVLGYDGSGPREREIECRTARARRDERGRFLTTLGSRFNERHFVGV